MKEILPVIQTILTHWVCDPDVVQVNPVRFIRTQTLIARNLSSIVIIQSIVDMLKKVLQTLMDDFREILPTACHFISQMCQYSQHPATLDLTKQVRTLRH